MQEPNLIQEIDEINNQIQAYQSQYSNKRFNVTAKAMLAGGLITAGAITFVGIALFTVSGPVGAMIGVALAATFVATMTSFITAKNLRILRENYIAAIVPLQENLKRLQDQATRLPRFNSNFNAIEAETDLKLATEVINTDKNNSNIDETQKLIQNKDSIELVTLTHKFMKK